MVPTTTEAVKKRKGPPTFQHLPTDQAKKLKKRWVETQKIKSKWKAEKRKTSQPSVRTPVAMLQTTVSPAEDNECSEDESPAPDESKTEGSQPKALLQKPPHRPKNRGPPNELHKSSGSTSSHPQGQNKAMDHRPPSKSSGDFAQKRRRSRQPDMRQRMNTLLEKIKRDYV
ncbi:hypothetical protein NEOLEDRAFT_1177678 [Neolentinus lepideus HHB14362 ss-1]|uniref:rRNA-processing protein FYV7 n=1 Tax=Neolentinus lepideus HHB14362 ss-1 TaxID=1314782 RepID=A0A165T7N9_9AGAM|nr:hypothetical protein NEOLEDRAFT_1177678 [Neolentinus lepideus HHB14362 ss-1]